MSSTLTSDLPAAGLWGGAWAATKKFSARFLVGVSTLLIARNVYDEAKKLNQDEQDGKLAQRSPSPCDDPLVVQSMAMAGSACVDPDLTMGALEGIRRVTVAPILEAASRAANYAHLSGVARLLDRGAQAEIPIPNTYEAHAGAITGEGLGAIGTYLFGEGEAKLAATVISGSNDINGVFDVADYLRGKRPENGAAGHAEKRTLLGKQGEPGSPHYMAIYHSDTGGYSIETANPGATAKIDGLNETQFLAFRDAARGHKAELRQAIVDANGDTKSFMASLDRLRHSSDKILNSEAAPSPEPASLGAVAPRSAPHGANTARLRAFTIPASPAKAAQASVMAAPRALSNPTPGHQ
jgi:hypothetical protein